MARKVKSKVTFKGEIAFPSDYLSAPELKGKDCIITIQAILKEQVQMSDGGKQSKLIMRIVGTPKKLVVNKTNADSIAQLYGTKAELWAGKRITIYPTTCMAFGDMVECIRVREVEPPPANGQAAKPAASKPEPAEQTDEAGPIPPPSGDMTEWAQQGAPK